MIIIPLLVDVVSSSEFVVAAVILSFVCQGLVSDGISYDAFMDFFGILLYIKYSER